MFTLSLSLVITSIYPCLSLYANVKCPSRDNTSPYSSFWRDNCIWPRGHFENEDSKPEANKKTKRRNPFFFSPRRETETLFFYPCGGVLLSTNLSLTPSCWHIGHKFFDSLLMISSSRAVFGSLSLLIAVPAIRSSKYKRHPESGRNWWYSALFREGSLIANTYPNI